MFQFVIQITIIRTQKIQLDISMSRGKYFIISRPFQNDDYGILLLQYET